MRALLLLLVALVVFPLSACTSSLPSLEGPGVVQFMVSTGTRWALAETNATVDEARKIETYILEAKAMLLDSSAPPTVVDDIGNYLSSKIENELVRRAINQGALFVKLNVTLPVGDKIPEEYKRWIFAVLDGATMGCAEYATMGADPRAVPTIATSSRISFR